MQPFRGWFINLSTVSFFFSFFFIIKRAAYFEKYIIAKEMHPPMKNTHRWQLPAVNSIICSEIVFYKKSNKHSTNKVSMERNQKYGFVMIFGPKGGIYIYIHWEVFKGG